mmetsp:Transcript_27633/g.77440  ORF Transcript_27633/g.77440 Transcript_27633/m.77440 type:complete len:82 (+) Transcript_27633:530-775(+)
MSDNTPERGLTVELLLGQESAICPAVIDSASMGVAEDSDGDEDDDDDDDSSDVGQPSSRVTWTSRGTPPLLFMISINECTV